MRHSDPEVVAMLAMGETDVPAPDVEHVHDCAECERELASLRRVADLAKSGSPDDALGAPRPEVWLRISEALGLRSDLMPGPMTGIAGPIASPVPEASAPDVVSSSSGRRHRAGRPRTRRRALIAVATVASVVAGALIVAAVLIRPAGGEVLATATLDALPSDSGSDQSGRATVEQRDDGTRDLVVRVDASTSGEGYREVWLGSPELDKLISLGALADVEGRFALPAGVDLNDYPVVDVSVEPIDGDPTHSGDSILRGSLDT